MHASPALYARGPYRVVVDATGDADRRYLVIDTAGTRLREDYDFTAACDWVDARMADLEAATPARVRTPLR